MRLSCRRRAYRTRLDLPVELRCDGIAAVARLVDVSASGAGLVLEAEQAVETFPEVGALLRLSLRERAPDLPPDPPWLGRLTYVGAGGPSAHRRLGVHFAATFDAAPTDLAANPDVALARETGLASTLVDAATRLGLPAVALLADQATKAWAWGLPTEPRALVPGWLEVAPGANPGVLGSLASGHPLTAPLCALGALGLVALNRRTSTIAGDSESHATAADTLGRALLGAGLLGNTVDRLALGHVRDFLVCGLLPGWVFNLADVYLLAGLAAILLARRGRSRLVTDDAVSPVA